MHKQCTMNTYPLGGRFNFRRTLYSCDSFISAMLDYLIQDNNLKGLLLQEDITDQDILFIKELIAGYIDPVTGNNNMQ